MFEAAESGRKISKKEYKARVPQLRQALLEVQQQLRQQDFPVIIVFAGVDGAGKGDTVNLLNEWMDPRWLITRAYTEPSPEESERPEYWRYWRDLPSAGKIGLFLSSWYSRPVLDLVYGNITSKEFDRQLDSVIAFENALAANGALILKFWMHLSHDGQEKRLSALEKDPIQSWRVSESDWKHWHSYDDFIQAAEHAIVKTGSDNAQWQVIEGADQRYRSLTVGQTVLDELCARLENVLGFVPI